MRTRALAAFALVLVSAWLADRAHAQDERGVFDEETGLWFPQDAPKESFLNGTAPKAYPLVLREHLEKDEALRREVCEWMASPRHQVSLEKVGPRVMQMHAMAGMLCVGIPAARESKKQMDAQEARLEKKYRGFLNLDAARSLDRDARAERAAEIFAKIEAGVLPPGDERLKAALEAVGLMPQNDTYLLAALEAFPGPTTIPGVHFRRFLSELFVSESTKDDAEGRRWRLGLRGLRFSEGNFAEARRLTAEALAHPFLSQHDYDRVFLAVLDRALGKRDTWDAMLADCHAPADFRPEKDAPPTQYCLEAAREITFRGIRELSEKSPAAFRDILLEGIAADPVNWPYRMESIRMLKRLDPALAAREAEAVLAIPATLVPEGARYDAIAALVRIARDAKDAPRALAAIDRFLSSLDFKTPAFPRDAWERLRSLGAADFAYEPPSGDLLEHVRWALGTKVTMAIEAKRLDLAKRTVETRLAAELRAAEETRGELGAFFADTTEAEDAAAREEAKKELEARVTKQLERAAGSVRYELVEVGRACLAAGDRAGALRILGFLYAQPNQEKPGVVTNLSSFRAETSRGGDVELKAETSPWDSEAPPPRPRRSSR